MDTVLTVTVPGVFEDLTVLGNIGGKQSLYRKRLVEMGRASDDVALDGPLYFLSEVGKVSLRDDVAHVEKVLDFVTKKQCDEGLRAAPVFFETRYIFRAKCGDDVKDVSVYHRLKSVTDGFTYADGWLFGDIDFINTPGRFTLALDVTFKDGKRRRISFRFMVVSVKMDVEGDYRKILTKIEKERRGLVQNFLSKTFGDTGFDPKGASNMPVWYAILEKVFDFYVGACRKIIHDPHRRYEGVVERRRADLVKRWTPSLVNRFKALSKDRRERELFRVERIEARIDTQENRFVLHTLRDIGKRLRSFAASYKEVKGISEKCIDGIGEQAETLERLAGNPFFRGVGPYTGGGAQSLVLQKRPGYAQILTTWVNLKQALSPESNGLDIGYRPLSALYEFWCFLTVRDKMRELMPESDGWTMEEDPKIASLEHLLDTDAEAGVDTDKTLCRMGYRFRKDARTVLLAYQQTYGTTEEGETFANVYEQRPDIVVSIRTGEGEEADAYTYLFDAKYRVDELDGRDASPRDAIDDMHRYRDAILYRRQRAGYSHEVIGAYVLFPGRLGDGTYNYAEMIEKENVGAFPLLPNRGSPLRNFLAKILDSSKVKRDHLARSIPPRGAAVVFAPDTSQYLKTEVVYGTYRSGQLDWIRKNHLYNMPVEVAATIGILNEADAKAKSMLFLVSGPQGHREKPSVFQIVPGSARKVRQKELVDEYGYKVTGNPEDNKEYWLWELVDTPESSSPDEPGTNTTGLQVETISPTTDERTSR